MDGTLRDNDISKIVEADRAHIWHHLIQHKPFETVEPRIIVEGKGMRVWDQNGKEHIDGVSGATLSLWAMTKIVKMALMLDEYIQNEKT